MFVPPMRRAGHESIFLPSPPASGYSMNTMRMIIAVLCLLLTLAALAGAADRLDPTPRIAGVSAFEPEWKALKASLREAESHYVNAGEFVTRTLARRPGVPFPSPV